MGWPKGWRWRYELYKAIIIHSTRARIRSQPFVPNTRHIRNSSSYNYWHSGPIAFQIVNKFHIYIYKVAWIYVLILRCFICGQRCFFLFLFIKNIPSTEYFVFSNQSFLHLHNSLILNFTGSGANIPCTLFRNTIANPFYNTWL